MQSTGNQVEKNAKRLSKLRDVMQVKKLKDDIDLAKAIGISQGYMSEIFSGKKNVPKTFGQKLEDSLGISRKWFDFDEGQMLLSDLKSNSNDIGEIQYPVEPGDTPFIQLGEGQYLMVMPLVNEYAYAGYLSGYADTEYIEELPKHTIVVTKYHRGQYRAFEIVGDSMDDNTKESIPDGSVVTGREIQKHHWNSKFHTHRFKDYVIVHQTEGIITKRIIHHDTIQGYITCRSLNPDKANYPDFDVQLDEVKQIFNIVNVSLAR
ncbi:LexA family transcriptional regulator [Pedobacter panaciterrae]